MNIEVDVYKTTLSIELQGLISIIIIYQVYHPSHKHPSNLKVR
jgi:hypothetical protein